MLVNGESGKRVEANIYKLVVGYNGISIDTTEIV
jgi:hypothetical protein